MNQLDSPSKLFQELNSIGRASDSMFNERFKKFITGNPCERLEILFNVLNDLRGFIILDNCVCDPDEWSLPIAYRRGPSYNKNIFTFIELIIEQVIENLRNLKKEPEILTCTNKLLEKINNYQDTYLDYQQDEKIICIKKALLERLEISKKKASLTFPDYLILPKELVDKTTKEQLADRLKCEFRTERASYFRAVIDVLSDAKMIYIDNQSQFYEAAKSYFSQDIGKRQAIFKKNTKKIDEAIFESYKTRLNRLLEDLNKTN